MFDTVLIANRGEIALRVIRACREMGLRSVIVFSDADADSLPVRLADDAVRIGPPAATSSYLDIPNVIGAALKSGAGAVHPGYGFLSEDPYFAEICSDHGLRFIGPPAQVMEAVGDKSTARRLMQDAGLPLLPGTVEPVGSTAQAQQVAAEIGYPLVIKASAGGGGRGITVVRDPESLPRDFQLTRAAAQSLFRNRDVYMERYLERVRHVEVQVLCDSLGNAVQLGERDCSVQRRHQKLVEESPSPGVGPELRRLLGEYALAGAKAVGYQGAGTMEFLLDEAGEVWFMEMNARIQVEHPVTEMITGVDLIAEQLRIAAGLPLSISQEQVQTTGHAIEVRVNAEDPTRDFAPTPGRLSSFRPAAGPFVRIDSHYRQGDLVPPFYDPMIAKLIVWGADRAAAIERCLRAVDEFEAGGPGVSTTLDFHRWVLSHPEFRDGSAHTDFLERHAAVPMTTTATEG